MGYPLSFSTEGRAYAYATRPMCMYHYEKMKNGTKLIYSEENGVDGKIDGPFTIDILQKLKKLIEESQ